MAVARRQLQLLTPRTLKMPSDERKRRDRDAHQRWLEKNPEYQRAYNKKYAETHRNRHFRSRYGITEADAQRLIDAQDGRCAICRIVPKKLVVDHCHASGAVRAMLCHKCNRGIGQFDDDPKLLEAAIRYLDLHRGLSELA